MDMITAYAQAKENDTAEMLGWRLIDGEAKIGETLAPSKIWTLAANGGEYEQTNENADGTSVFSDLKDMLEYAKYSAKGFTLALVGGDRGRIDDNQELLAGERIVRDAVVLATWTRNSSNEEWR